MRINLYSDVKRLITAIVISTLLGCGGGTTGTGLRTYQGTISLSDKSPLSNAAVTLEETGESSTTDAAGSFTLHTSSDSSDVTLSIKRAEISTAVNIDNIPQDIKRVVIDLQVDPLDNSAETTRLDFHSVDEFSLQALIEGDCAAAFIYSDNGIEQRRQLKDGSECTLRATVLGDGDPRGAILVGIERRGCDPSDTWRLVATKRTATQPQAGVARIKFKFYDNEAACFYRISAPFRDSLTRDDHVSLLTLTAKGESKTKSRR